MDTIALTGEEREGLVEDWLLLLDLPAGRERARCRAALRAAAAAAGATPIEGLRAWFGGILGPVPLESARAAFLLAGGARRWPGELLSPRPSERFRAALRQHLPFAVPDEQAAEMPARPLRSREGGEERAPAPLCRPRLAGDAE